jgi:hypothetical protein
VSAVVVDPSIVADLSAKTTAHPPGTTFWLMAGTHRLVDDRYGQVRPKNGNTYLGAPGAVLDGRGVNRYAFVGLATNVTIKGLTVRGFVPPVNEGVVNHDSGAGWVIEGNTLIDNRGAALMAGARQIVRGNCIKDRGQRVRGQQRGRSGEPDQGMRMLRCDEVLARQRRGRAGQLDP